MIQIHRGFDTLGHQWITPEHVPAESSLSSLPENSAEKSASSTQTPPVVTDLSASQPRRVRAGFVPRRTSRFHTRGPDHCQDTGPHFHGRLAHAPMIACRPESKSTASWAVGCALAEFSLHLCLRNCPFLVDSWGCVDVDNVDGKIRGRAVAFYSRNRPDHRQDAGSHRLGQCWPGVNDRLQVGVDQE